MLWPDGLVFHNSTFIAQREDRTGLLIDFDRSTMLFTISQSQLQRRLTTHGLFLMNTLSQVNKKLNFFYGLRFNSL